MTTQTQTQAVDLLANALRYAEAGWPVLPLHTPTEAGCSCRRADCESVGKHPRTRHGVKDATCEPGQIRAWWHTWPEANVGIRTGAEAGIVVLDVDGDEGRQSTSDKAIPPTATARTGDGEHKYFAHPDGTVKNFTKKLPGLDLKGDGGYVVAPPSLHVSGRRYEWLIPPWEEQPASCPAWLLELLNAQAESTVPAPSADGRITVGARNDTLASLAGTMRRRGMSYESILAALLAENGGKCDPPLEESEVERIARSISGYAPAEEEAPDGDPEVGWTKFLADAILETDHFAVDAGDRLYYYHAGSYRLDGKRHIARRCKELLENWNRPAKWTTYRVGQVQSYIAVDRPALWKRPPRDVLNVKNGLLDLQTGELRPHSPEHLSAVQLPVEYDPGADCPAWHKFTDAWFPPDTRDLPWELLAWLMCPDMSIQKAVLLLGSGGNGKSRFLNAVKTFLGYNNVTGMSLHTLEGNRFATSNLVDKLANICPDLPSDHLTSTSVFKALTGGDSRLSAEIKHGIRFDFECYARLVFSANHPPASNDSTRAFFDRWLVVPFNRRFRGTPEEIPAEELDEMLADPAELSGALNMALIHLQRVRERGITETESMQKAWYEFREVTDPVEVWLDLNTVQGPELYVTKSDLFDAYRRNAKEEGRPRMTASQFSGAVKEWNPDLREGQKRLPTGRPKVWYGIGLRVDDNWSKP